jgi:hypothetical protein
VEGYYLREGALTSSGPASFYWMGLRVAPPLPSAWPRFTWVINRTGARRPGRCCKRAAAACPAKHRAGQRGLPA